MTHTKISQHICIHLLGILLIVSLFFNACNSPSPEAIKAKEEAMRLAKIKSSPFYKEVVVPYENHVLNSISEEMPPGVAVAIIKDREVYYSKGLGEKVINTKDKVDNETVFRIASVSKGFAAVVVGRLVEEGHLNWDDKVIDYVPELKLKDSLHTTQLTIRHILSHTTGMPRHTYGNLIEAKVPFPKMIKMLEKVDIISKPGELFSYQNVMYNLISPICEKATGKDYGTLVKEYIFEPLNMQNASISFEAIINESNVAQPHNHHNKRPKPIKEAYYKVLPSAGVNASINDMAKYTLALLGNDKEVLSDELRESIFSPYVELPDNNRYSRLWGKLSSNAYGMGWRIINYDNTELVYHGGFVNGYRAEMAMNLKDNIAVVVLTNASSEFANKCIPHFFDLYHQHKNKQLELEQSTTASPAQK